MRCKEKVDGKVCDGPIKPNITFFGEGLPKEFFDAVEKIEDPDEELEKDSREPLIDFTKGMKDDLDKIRDELKTDYPTTLEGYEEMKKQ
mgnify:CR=1 FL=1